MWYLAMAAISSDGGWTPHSAGVYLVLISALQQLMGNDLKPLLLLRCNVGTGQGYAHLLAHVWTAVNAAASVAQ